MFTQKAESTNSGTEITLLERNVNNIRENNVQISIFIDNFNQMVLSRIDNLSNKLNASDYYKNRPQPTPTIDSIIQETGLGSNAKQEGIIHALAYEATFGQILNERLISEVFRPMEKSLDFFESQI